ncbi:hypothetical protein HMPREF2822_12430 [Corynebacterium sp. HMSC062E11]|uniref:hypothetical protein n=1 Tax=Corynebacterium sp. HMSC062E11 TaxID=1739326 RepID=UPI0008A1C369|nr:hypothetical protein [Corynebacterium sp. HMSC062E11]OFK27242.1 hypothetical protein HMPREF2822_12430 [Corynebacterium sp. HMSC062E11]
MGIRPNNGDQVETNYRVDGSTEAQQLITDAEHTGNEAGKVFAEVAAKADSANAGATELSKRVAALEKNAARPFGLVEAVAKGTTTGSGYQANVVDVRAPSDGWAYRSGANMRPKPGLWRVELIQEPGANLILSVANQAVASVGGTTQIVNFSTNETAIVVGQGGTPEGKAFYVLFTRLS